METNLDFEKPIFDLEKKLQDLKTISEQEKVDFSQEIKLLQKKVNQLIDKTFSQLNPWQKVQLSRHSLRPYTKDYITELFPDFMEVHGDRAFGEDKAILAGIASWPPVHPKNLKKTNPDLACSVVILGHQKGRTTKQKMEHNFGMAKPEGYRKAMRLMNLAHRLKMPIITFIDTPGAYPGIEAEERGQAQAIAESIELGFKIQVPIITVIIGEGGSGGALALGVANTILMQEYSTYSVISPESCASILWNDSSYATKAATKLKMTPQSLLDLKIIDFIIPEPKGGAHKNHQKATEIVGNSLIEHLEPLLKVFKQNPEKILKDRIHKFRIIGSHTLKEAKS